MLSVSALRNAAAMSARRSTMTMRVAAPSLTMRRTYATENGKEETSKEGEAAAAAAAAPEIKVELTEEVKAMLAEKDKKIKELQVNYLFLGFGKESEREIRSMGRREEYVN
jgi:hypothetical protein